MTHTAESVRAACERAGIQVCGDPVLGHEPPNVWRVTDVPGRRHLVVEYSAGDLWWNGRCIHPTVKGCAVSRVNRVVQLEAQIRALQEALAPIAALADAYTDDAVDDAIVLRYEQASGRRTLTVGHLRNARVAFAAK